MKALSTVAALMLLAACDLELDFDGLFNVGAATDA